MENEQIEMDEKDAEFDEEIKNEDEADGKPEIPDFEDQKDL